MTKTTAGGKVYAYCRVSTTDQTNAPQKNEIVQYVKLRGLETPEFFCDVGESGGKNLADRPAGAELLKRLKRGDTVIIARLDRAFRRASDSLMTIERWVKQGINLHIVSFGGDSINMGSAIGKMLLQLLAAFSEFERSLISERTKEGLKLRAGNPPMGYRVRIVKDPTRPKGKRGIFEFDPDERRHMAQILKWHEEGFGIREIARKCYAARFKRAPRHGRPAADWNKDSVILAIKLERQYQAMEKVIEPDDCDLDGLDDRPTA